MVGSTLLAGSPGQLVVSLISNPNRLSSCSCLHERGPSAQGKTERFDLYDRPHNGLVLSAETRYPHLRNRALTHPCQESQTLTPHSLPSRVPQPSSICPSPSCIPRITATTSSLVNQGQYYGNGPQCVGSALVGPSFWASIGIKQMPASTPVECVLDLSLRGNSSEGVGANVRLRWDVH